MKQEKAGIVEYLLLKTLKKGVCSVLLHQPKCPKGVIERIDELSCFSRGSNYCQKAGTK